MYLRQSARNSDAAFHRSAMDTQADLQTRGTAFGIGRGDGTGRRRIEPRLPVGILDRQRLGPRLPLRLCHFEADVSQRGSRLGLQPRLVQPELVRSDLVESDSEVVEDLGVGVNPAKLLKRLDRGVWGVSGSRKRGGRHPSNSQRWGGQELGKSYGSTVQRRSYACVEMIARTRIRTHPLEASEKQRRDRGNAGVLAQKIPRARDHLERGCLVADEFGRGDVLPQGVGAAWVVDVRPGVGGGVEVLRGVSNQQSPGV